MLATIGSVLLPFLALVGLYQVGLDPSGALYWVLVGALGITAVTIWAECLDALEPELPPDAPDRPAPRASAVIAAYLPNEADTLVETVSHFLRQEYAGGLQVVVAYNTPTPMAVEVELAAMAEAHRDLTVLKVSDSTSKAQNVNAALSVTDGEFVGIFDADHHPMPGAFDRAWQWLASGADVVQGHCVIRNGESSALAKLIAVEFEQIYAVAHPGRAHLHGFGIFGGSNGYWTADAIGRTRLRGSFLTEDIEASMRLLAEGGRIVNDPGLISYELAPETPQALWKQRMRWAQGWFQVSCQHLGPILRSPHLALRQKAGAAYLLAWRELYPWVSLMALPLLALHLLARRRHRHGLPDLRAGLPVHHRVRPAADPGRLAARGAGGAPAPVVVRGRRARQPGRLHRAEEPGEPRRPPQAAARRAPVGGHPAYRLDHVRHVPHLGGDRMTGTLAPPSANPPANPSASRSASASASGAATAAPAKRLFPLQWLRGVAALLVVTFHAYQYNRSGPTWQWPLSGVAHEALLGTDLFVDMFFVLSAFVLWLPVAKTALAGRPGRPGWLMLMRRMARLLPLYATVVAVVWAISNPSLPGHWQDLALHLTFTHVYSDTYIFWTNGPAWSLAVEFHFYVLIALAIPVVRRATARATTDRGRLLVALALPVACLLAGLAYLAWATLVSQPESTDWSAWFNPLAKASDFGIGMLLAVLSARGVRLGGPARAAAATIGIAALGVLVLSRGGESLATNWWHPMYAVAIAVALCSIVLHDGPSPRWMSWQPLVWVGGLGYGIYLIHEPVLRLLGFLGVLPEPRPGPQFLITALLVAVPAVVLAWVSSRTVEQAGMKVLQLVDGQGRARDYYAHVPRQVERTG